ARPCGAGRTRRRFFVGPRSTNAVRTQSSSGSIETFAFSAASLALAIAERMHFSILLAARFFVNRKIANAWLTSLPRIISTTSRAFWADPRKYFALAVASIVSLVTYLLFGRRSRDLACLFHLRARVALERSRRRKLTELVAHHVFRHVDRQMAFAVVHSEREPNHVRRDRRATRPCLDHRRPLAARARL